MSDNIGDIDEVNEMCVIGALLLADNNENISNCFAKLTEKFFTVKELGLLFENLKKQFDETGQMDTVLACTLGSGYADIIKSCMDRVPSHILLPQYVQLVFNSHRVNYLTWQLSSLINRTSKLDKDVFISEFKRLVEIDSKFDELRDADTSTNMLEALAKYLDSLNKKEQVFKTGLNSFDYRTGGFMRKSFNVITGRSGSGKTDFAIFLATKFAAKGHKVLYLSMEMPTNQIINRIASRVTEIDSMVLNDKENLKLDTIALLVKSLDRIAKLPIIFDEQQAISLSDIQAKIRQHKPDIIFIDHMGLMKRDSRKAMWEGIFDISQGFKRLVMNNNIVVFALVQQNSDVEKRSGKTTRLSDVKGSDGIGNDADGLFGIRADKSECELSGTAYINAYVDIVKCREGKQGSVIELHWQPQYHKYTEVVQSKFI